MRDSLKMQEFSSNKVAVAQNKAANTSQRRKRRRRNCIKQLKLPLWALEHSQVRCLDDCKIDLNVHKETANQDGSSTLASRLVVTSAEAFQHDLTCCPRSMKRNEMPRSTIKHLFSLLPLAAACTVYCFFLYLATYQSSLVNCQRLPTEASSLPLQLQQQQQQQQQQQPRFSVPIPVDPSEFRVPESAGIGNQAQVPPNAQQQTPQQRAAFQQLVNLLQNYASQQSSGNRIPLQPLQLQSGGRATNLNQQLSQVQANQQQFPQFSTPITPFNQQQPFQTNRRVSFPGAPPVAGSPNQLAFVSSSPATPHLTLNRLANNQQQQASNGRPAFSSLQPLNTIPLGRPIPISGVPIAPSRTLSPQQPGQNPNLNQPAQQQQQQQQQRPPQLFSQAQMNNGLRKPQVPVQVKPIMGFAPSGPPPNPSLNQALVVVQSPPVSQMPNQGSSPASFTQASPAATSDQQSTPPQTSTELSASTATADSIQSSPDDAVATTAATSPVATSSSSTPTSDSGESVKGNSSSGESSWNPLEFPGTAANSQNSSNPRKIPLDQQLAPSPDIVTVAPGFNVDQQQANNLPQNYDIPVSAQMGGDSASGSQQQQQHQAINNPAGSLSTTNIRTAELPVTPSISVAPTAVTTIVWTPPATESPPPQTAQTVTSQLHQASSIYSYNSPTQTSLYSQPAPDSNSPASSSSSSSSNTGKPAASGDLSSSAVVYGKPQARDSKPAPPSSINPSPVSGQASIESSLAGRPFIQPVQMDNQVRPFAAAAPAASQHSLAAKSNHQRPSGGASSSRPFGEAHHVGSGFQIAATTNQSSMPMGDIQDYLAQPPLLVPTLNRQLGMNQEPTISAQGGQDPAVFELSASESISSSHHTNHTSNHQVATIGESASSSQVANPVLSQQQTPLQQPPQASSSPQRVRRPTFKPKPLVPPIRIDSCIVNDDSSCDQSHNERCVTEYGISSCHCKPGFARLSQLRGYCSPVSALQLSMKIDKLSDDRRLAYNQTLGNSSSEEYQYLEFETIQALAGAFQQSSLAKQFMGARVNRFFERKGKVYANVSVMMEANNLTRSQDRISTLANQELLKVAGQASALRRPIGDSTIMLDSSRDTISKLSDINECASKDLNDCSDFASCTNDFGSFQCQCLAGYEDKHASAEEKAKHGRVCLGCPASYCSNRGVCLISDGEKRCKCRPNFIGARCDIDTEVLAVAIGGSIIGIIILASTFWCLFVFNRRWKREQQKLDAMSATSGLTYNYVNSASTNSLMSPARMGLGAQLVHTGGGGGGGGLHRSGGHQVGALAANYGQRFGAALVGGGRQSQQHYAPDQQAIIGSASSGSSAASQPLCNPYQAAAYQAAQQQYEDAGLLIAPASTGSSEQTSPGSNSYRAAGNAYTLSGHHHHHHHHHPSHHHHAHLQAKAAAQITQFHPAADYNRTLNTHCNQQTNSNGAQDGRWRTLQQEHSKQQSALLGYYLSPDMLNKQQQLYSSPQRELCIDTGGLVSSANQKAKRQQGRAANGQTLRSRSHNHLNNNNSAMYHGHLEYEH